METLVETPETSITMPVSNPKTEKEVAQPATTSTAHRPQDQKLTRLRKEAADRLETANPLQMHPRVLHPCEMEALAASDQRGMREAVTATTLIVSLQEVIPYCSDFP